VILPLDGSGPAQLGENDPEARLHFSKHIKFELKDGTETIEVPFEKTNEWIRVALPSRLLRHDTETISFQWGNK